VSDVNADGGRVERIANVDYVSQYRIAYEQVQRAVDDQTDELNGIRDRAVAYAAFIGAATAFLVGSTVKGIAHDATYLALASSGTLVFVVSIIALWRVIRPTKKAWQIRLSGAVLVDDWIDSRDVPKPTDAQLIRALALRYDQMREANEVVLGGLRRSYVTYIVASMIQLAMWIVLAWAHS
jgi:hypothetical protein